MFQRFHEMRERDERGFTLIELLVVILIIAILAAIAIPVFLNQRKKGWVSQSQSALKNAATAMESYGTSTGGNYTGATTASLTSNGYVATQNVTMTVTVTNSGQGYCLFATHANFETTETDRIWTYDSDGGTPVTTDTCT